MPTHLVFSSVAQRLDAGTYSPAVVRNLAAPPSSPMAASFAPLWTYAASALMGALIGLMLGGAL